MWLEERKREKLNESVSLNCMFDRLLCRAFIYMPLYKWQIELWLLCLRSLMRYRNFGIWRGWFVCINVCFLNFFVLFLVFSLNVVMREEKMSPRHWVDEMTTVDDSDDGCAIIDVSNEQTQCNSVDFCCALNICLNSWFFFSFNLLSSIGQFRVFVWVCVWVCFVFFRLQSNLNHNKFQLVNSYDKDFMIFFVCLMLLLYLIFFFLIF